MQKELKNIHAKHQKKGHVRMMVNKKPMWCKIMYVKLLDDPHGDKYEEKDIVKVEFDKKNKYFEVVGKLKL